MIWSVKFGKSSQKEDSNRIHALNVAPLLRLTSLFAKNIFYSVYAYFSPFNKSSDQFLFNELLNHRFISLFNLVSKYSRNSVATNIIFLG